METEEPVIELIKRRLATASPAYCARLLLAANWAMQLRQRDIIGEIIASEE